MLSFVSLSLSLSLPLVPVSPSTPQTLSTDIASWTSSCVSSDPDDDLAGLDFLQTFDQKLSAWSSSTAGPAARSGHRGAPSSRLPFFVGLHAQGTGKAVEYSSSSSAGNGGRGGAFCLLPPGGGSGGGDSGGYVNEVRWDLLGLPGGDIQVGY